MATPTTAVTPPAASPIQQLAELREATRRTVRILGVLQGEDVVTRCSPAQCHSLLEISMAGRLTVGELARRLRLDKSTTSRAVKPLLVRDLLQIEPDPDDQRSKPLVLTDKGRERVALINRIADGQVSAALDLLPAEERETVVLGMSLYAKALDRAERLRGISIRPIEKRDDRAMGQIIQSVMTEYGAVGVGFSSEDAEVHAMTAAYEGPRARFYVIEETDRDSNESRILGGAGIGPLAGADAEICELRKMYLVPESRGLGLGRHLLELCLATARDAGYRQCYLETMERMTQARNLYAKTGFRPLEAPRGATGHFGCDAWYALDL